jgi:hypothetical protein
MRVCIDTVPACLHAMGVIPALIKREVTSVRSSNSAVARILAEVRTRRDGDGNRISSNTIDAL